MFALDFVVVKRYCTEVRSSFILMFAVTKVVFHGEYILMFAVTLKVLH